MNINWLVKNETVNQGISNNTVGGGGAISSKTIFDVVKWMSDANFGFIGRNLDDAYDFLVFDDTSFFSGLSGFEVNSMTNASSNAVVSNVVQAEFVDPLEEVTVSGQTVKVIHSDWTGLKLFFKGYIRQIGFRTGKDEPATLRGTIEFLEGNNVVSYQGAMPNSAQNLNARTASSNPHNTINIRWRTPRHTGNSAITHWLIGYKIHTDSDFDWQLSTNSGADTNVDLSGLTPSTDYDFKVVAFNTEGRGEESDEVYFSTTAAP